MRKRNKPSSYEVGYKKPPVHSRFPKGKSGNSRGRPKGSANYLTLLRRVLGQKVAVTEDGKRRRITKIEAAMTQLLNKAALGDTRAFNATLKVVTLLGLKPEREKGGLTFIIEG
jgi:Family of unknown function (DUF5681)